jgi:hypothetical protein
MCQTASVYFANTASKLAPWPATPPKVALTLDELHCPALIAKTPALLQNNCSPPPQSNGDFNDALRILAILRDVFAAPDAEVQCQMAHSAEAPSHIGLEDLIRGLLHSTQIAGVKEKERQRKSSWSTFIIIFYLHCKIVDFPPV